VGCDYSTRALTSGMDSNSEQTGSWWNCAGGACLEEVGHWRGASLGAVLPWPLLVTALLCFLAAMR
jgi:hypothetical protein